MAHLPVDLNADQFADPRRVPAVAPVMNLTSLPLQSASRAAEIEQRALSAVGPAAWGALCEREPVWVISAEVDALLRRADAGLELSDYEARVVDMARRLEGASSAVEFEQVVVRAALEAAARAEVFRQKARTAAARALAEESGSAASLAPVDMAAALDAPDVLPKLLLRSDGRPLLYPGCVHSFAGSAGSGKSWVALKAIAEVLSSGGSALLVDVEVRPGVTAGRLRRLGVDRSVLVDPDRFVLLNPTIDPAGTDEWEQLLLRGFDVVAIDSVSMMLTLRGADDNSTMDVANWMREVPVALAHRTGAAVVLIDHTPKTTLVKSHSGAIGSQSKKAQVDVQFVVTRVAESPDDESATGDVHSQVTVTKDRHGGLPDGKFDLTVTGHERVLVEFTGAIAAAELGASSSGGPGQITPKLAVAVKYVIDFLAANPDGESVRAIRDSVPSDAPGGLARRDIEPAAARLKMRGIIHERRDGNRRPVVLDVEYREKAVVAGLLPRVDGTLRAASIEWNPEAELVEAQPAAPSVAELLGEAPLEGL